MATSSQKPSMWYEELPIDHSWSALWYGYTICGRCHGIRGSESACRACGDCPQSFEPQVVRFEDGREERVVFASMGAEGDMKTTFT